MEGDSRPASGLRYKLDLTCTSFQPGSEVWILLSQHITNKDRSSDDIALHVHEEHQAVPIGSSGSTAQVEKMASSVGSPPSYRSLLMCQSPYSNAVHVLVRRFQAVWIPRLCPVSSYSPQRQHVPDHSSPARQRAISYRLHPTSLGAVRVQALSRTDIYFATILHFPHKQFDHPECRWSCGFTELD